MASKKTRRRAKTGRERAETEYAAALRRRPAKRKQKSMVEQISELVATLPLPTQRLYLINLWADIGFISREEARYYISFPVLDGVSDAHELIRN